MKSSMYLFAKGIQLGESIPIERNKKHCIGIFTLTESDTVHTATVYFLGNCRIMTQITIYI